VAYQLMNNGSLQYAVDWDVVDRLVRAYWRAESRNSYSRVVKSSDKSWYNPVSWSLPEIEQIEVDWNLVRSQSDSGAADDRARLRQVGATNVRGVAEELEWKVARTGKLTTSFVDDMGAIQSANMARIDNAVSAYGSQIEVAKFLRDTSADGLMVGATLLSGGTAAAVLTGGSAMKGWAKYQDTDSVGAAVMQGFGSFVFTAIPMGGALTAGQKWTLVLVQSSWESGMALAEGKSLAEAIPTGALKLTGPGCEKIFGKAGVIKMLEKAGIPLRITVAGEDVAAKFVDKLGGKVLQKQGVEKRVGKQAVEALVGGATRSAQPESGMASGALVRDATFTDDLLLKFAIVNMQKGIGWGW
jgi:hypothetical protein